MKEKLLLLAILLLAFCFRFNNINWDNNFHLNPDERFLTMTAMDKKIPDFFVYGMLPLTVNEQIASIFNRDNYDDFTLLGRQLAGFVDVLVVILVFQMVKLLESRYKLDKSVKFLAAFFYAIAVFPIQSAHFFTVDPFLNFFMFASFYYALKSSVARTSEFVLTLSAIFFGCAMASKITAVYILPLLFYFIILHKDRLRNLILFSIVAYLSLHIASPNYFASSNPLNPLPNGSFMNSIKQLSSFNNPAIWYPPGVQWIHKLPIIFSLINMVVFGVGIPYFVLAVVGIWWIISKINPPAGGQKSKILFVILIWVILFFLYQSTVYVKTMRYFIFLYPFLAILAGIGTANVIGYELRVRRLFVSCLLIVISLIWPLAFSTIYLRTNSRVAASEWIYRSLPNNSVILGEYWDDPLPLPVKDTQGKSYRIEQLPVFDPDTPEKWQKMDQMLDSADYYILSSNRGWGSIPTVPEKYPRMSQFYADLLAGKTNYQKIAEFTSYPIINDDWAEEAFTVYDHPKVLIFRNSLSQNIK